ncbi:uncharacterized protein LOC119555949 [Drosophila subpulchrella]|uniref:uncharacterized protein LOC119555949 n=1 Tax=Drosophila subpulchrella TaxID=1486046 RepID=UPI0018A1649A|nr:uncharacterized protein LOC119555949 [Drosophila subpulchrella]
MISQDSLGVNSEVEVFSALICWLAYRPQEMTKLMPHLTGCVRFTLIPLPVLRKLWDISSVPSSPSDPDGTLLGAFHYDLDMRYRISISITVASLRLLHPNRSEFLRSLRDVGEEAPREWMYDETCSYHLPYPKGPYCHVMNGQAIFSYVSQRANEFQPWPRRSRSLLPATNDLQTIEEVPAEFECRESEEEDQNENFLIELRALFLKLDLFLPHEGDPQPYEPEAITSEDENYLYETYVQETDRQIRGILKELDQNVMPQLSL